MRTTFTLTLALFCGIATTEASAQGKGSQKAASSQSHGRGHSGNAPAVGTQLGGAGAPWDRSGVSRADWLLANRLAAINHMREVAQRNGNERMLDQADKLEAIARRQFLIHACSGHSPCEQPPESP